MFQEADDVSRMDERAEVAFVDEYARLKHEGFDALMEKRFDELLFEMYRRGYIRGHADRSRDYQQDEAQAIREGRVPMGVDIRYEGDKLFLGGKDVTPRKDER